MTSEVAADGRDSYYLDFSASFDESIDKACAPSSLPEAPPDPSPLPACSREPSLPPSLAREPSLLSSLSGNTKNSVFEQISACSREPSLSRDPSLLSSLSTSLTREPSLLSSLSNSASSERTVISLAQSPTEPRTDWAIDSQGGDGASGTLDSACTEGSLEEPRYAKVTHKQKRASSSTPKLARRRQEEHRLSREDSVRYSSVGVSTRTSPLHQLAEPLGEVASLARPPSTFRPGQEEEQGQDRTLTSTATTSTPSPSPPSARDSLQKAISAMYFQLLLILGLVIPLTSSSPLLVSTRHLELFYIYLLLASLLFLIFVYLDLLQTQTRQAVTSHRRKRSVQQVKEKLQDSQADSGRSSKSSSSGGRRRREEDEGRREEELPVSLLREGGSFSSLLPRPRGEYGSFYLRLGTMLFGMGSLIYSGIEVGCQVEWHLQAPACSDLLLALRPTLQILLVLLQTYFLFLNHRMNLYKRKAVSRLGLMHLAATNICLWLKELLQEVHKAQEQEVALVQEQEMALVQEQESALVQYDEDQEMGNSTSLPLPLSLSGSCSSAILAQLRLDSRDYLFPCMAQYSIVAAVLLLVIWANMKTEHQHYRLARHRLLRPQVEGEGGSSCHRYGVDCRNSNTGLFCGLLVVVAALVSIILFFVFVAREEEALQLVAVQVSAVSQLCLYSLTAVVVLVGSCQVRSLWFSETASHLQIDRLILLFSQLGVCSQAALSAVGCSLQLEGHLLQLLASLAQLCQPLLQTVFLLDASRRVAATPAQARSKPGRQAVTFLLVCNLAMWAASLLESARQEARPSQVGVFSSTWAWPLVCHLALPLTMLYRFHSSVCLYEIWKKSFRLRQPNIDFI